MTVYVVPWSGYHGGDGPSMVYLNFDDDDLDHAFCDSTLLFPIISLETLS